MQEEKKDILEIIDDGIQEAYCRFKMEELKKGKVIKRDPMLLKSVKEF